MMPAGKLQRRKAALRRIMTARRAAIPPDERQVAAGRVAAKATALIAGNTAPTIAGYMPAGDEFDALPLLAALVALGAQTALPVVTGPGKPLEFRLWQAGNRLIPGAYGIDRPAGDAPAKRPDIILLPMLAFDRHGRRLGYGGGYYDRTLAQLRGSGDVMAIGLAFAAQMVEEVPSGPHDAVLDRILTEEGMGIV